MMGTRNLTCVVVDGQFKVAQYGQWDGYPEGQGATCCLFIQKADIDAFRTAVREVTEVSSEDLKALWVECGADPESDFVDMKVSDRFKKKHPQFSRDAGAEILTWIMEGVRQVNMNVEFAKDSLFCEWCYVLDLDNEVLEVYGGFRKEPTTEGRFASDVPKEGYFPVSLEHTIPFSDIKERGAEALLSLYANAD